MKLLLKYLTPYKGLITLTMVLAAINIGFSLIDPILFGKLINLANQHQGIEKPPTHIFILSAGKNRE
jgi:ATP-binding cassette, subfamily B, bacterial